MAHDGGNELHRLGDCRNSHLQHPGGDGAILDDPSREVGCLEGRRVVGEIGEATVDLKEPLEGGRPRDIVGAIEGGRRVL